MVIPSDRTKAANTIAAYLRGEADNFALDKDETIWQIGLVLWGSYDDIKRHTVSLSRQEWKLFRRCTAFLQTDLELPKGCGKRDVTIWPFQERRQLFAARPRLESFNLPIFDPAIHNVPIRSRMEARLMWTPWLILAGILLIALSQWLSGFL